MSRFRSLLGCERGVISIKYASPLVAVPMMIVLHVSCGDSSSGNISTRPVATAVDNRPYDFSSAHPGSGTGGGSNDASSQERHASGPFPSLGEPETESEGNSLYKFDDYSLIVTAYELEGFPYYSYRLTKSGKTLSERKDLSEDPVAQENGHWFAMGKDFNGDGKPNLVLEEATGGLGCCRDLVVFELGKEPKKLAVVEARGSNIEFEDLDGDGFPEIKLLDDAFAYWEGPNPGSPMPQVILKWNGYLYDVASRLMISSGPGPEQLKRSATKLRIINGGASEPEMRELSKKMLELIYTGNSEKAWLLFDMAWKKNTGRKDSFRERFESRCRTSRFWRGIEQLNQAADTALHWSGSDGAL